MQHQYFLLVPIILPIVAGILVKLLKMENKTNRQIFVGATIIVNTLITIYTLLSFQGQYLRLIDLVPGFSITLGVDSMSVVFGMMVSILWMLTTFYAFGYMSHEGNEVRFFTFFTCAMGVCIGLALAANLLTFYLFYEFLTFITFPLIIHSGTDEAITAGRNYLIYSITGAALALVCIVFIGYYSTGANFTFGGILDMVQASNNKELLCFVFLLGFLGFGVKAAVFPMHGWLANAYVAPAPATALLHAVAVVKAGVFGIMRLAYFAYGTDLIRGTWVQGVCLGLVFITIIYGSYMAVRTQHLKKRLAYSTIGQLSYILFAVMLLNPDGLRSGLIYMIFHAIIKITLFFCCGSIMFTTHETDVNRMDGFGQLMPMTFTCFFIASLGMMGIPATAGFIGKWNLFLAAMQPGSFPYGIIGLLAVAISILLTVIYLMSVIIKAFFIKGESANSMLASKEAPVIMNVPVFIITVLILLFGLIPSLVTNFIFTIGTTL